MDPVCERQRASGEPQAPAGGGQAPWQAAGLTEAEYRRACELLGREPNGLELGMLGVLWSEHCAYKHSRPLLGRLPSRAPHVLLGPGENAGAVDLGDGTAVVFRIESHNHPSYVEPFQGAATGVGGILRDVLALGARPIALLNSLRFGEPGDELWRRLFTGVVKGIAHYGNCAGVPTVGGELHCEPGYRTNPLVNVMCIGVAPARQLVRAVASRPGSLVVLIGAPTGRDGIHGATFASAGLGADAEERRPAVQIGDPFTGKLLIEACLELAGRGAVLGLQDLGAGGIASACAETASRAGTGVDIDVARVPRREPGMTPYEVVLSESQERMLAIVAPDRQAEVREICRAWSLEAAVIGRVTSDGLFRVREAGRTVAEVPVEVLTRGAPVYTPAAAFPPAPVLDPAAIPQPRDQQEAGAALRRLLASPAIASKAWVYTQFDHMVQTNTVLRPGSGDAAVLRVPGSRKAIAAAVDGNGRYTALDPRRGAALAVAKAARNVSCVGARPLGLTNCLNFGNPEHPEVYGQLSAAVDGLAEACRELGIPVVGGNVSLYNETGGRDIDPTPVVGVVGVLDDPARRAASHFEAPGEVIVLLGPPRGYLGGSEYLKRLHGRVAGPLAPIDWALERNVQALVREAVAGGRVRVAHDLAEGGLAVGLAEMCFGGGTPAPGAPPGGPALGAEVELPAQWLRDGRVDELLFGEAPSRVLVAAAPEQARLLAERAAALNVPCTVIGRVTREPRLRLRIGGRTWLDEPVAGLQRVWEEAIPCALATR
ncbi:MAG TPA: phosphoribosylformylglycinamidine synthase subunit PurL [Thermaerobacter sp.]